MATIIMITTIMMMMMMLISDRPHLEGAKNKSSWHVHFLLCALKMASCLPSIFSFSLKGIVLIYKTSSSCVFSLFLEGKHIRSRFISTLFASNYSFGTKYHHHVKYDFAHLFCFSHGARIHNLISRSIISLCFQPISNTVTL